MPCCSKIYARIVLGNDLKFYVVLQRLLILVEFANYSQKQLKLLPFLALLRKLSSCSYVCFCSNYGATYDSGSDSEDDAAADGYSSGLIRRRSVPSSDA